MNEELKILDKIASTSSKLDKAQLLVSNNTNTRLADLLDAVFNYKRKFFIKKLEMPLPHEEELDNHDDFIKILKVLESGMHRGDSAKNIVEQFFILCNEQQQLWYYRVLTKDLKAGFSVDTAIENGFDKIPVFDVMLAKDGKLNKNLDTLMKSGGYASKKMDGYRCLADVRDGFCTLFSRNGTEYANFQSIEQQLVKCFPTDKYIFDGEIMSDDFQSMQKSAFANKRGTTIGDVKYHIFDIIPVAEWDSGKFKETKSARYARLKKMFDDGIFKETNMVLVEHEFVNSYSKILELEAKWLAEGFEGAMWVPDVPYYLGKKSNKMLKFKTFKSQDVRILGFNEGEAGSKFEGTLGCVTVMQENGLPCDCGSGFNDADRAHIWANQKSFISKMFEAKYQELTPDGKMRFPVFIRWRNDKK
jgi:DNA ligase-1